MWGHCGVKLGIEYDCRHILLRTAHWTVDRTRAESILKAITFVVHVKGGPLNIFQSPAIYIVTE